MSTSQLTKLETLITAAMAAKSAAATGDLFVSRQGQALVNAMFDLTEVDGLYALSQDIEHEAATSGVQAAA